MYKLGTYYCGHKVTLIGHLNFTIASKFFDIHYQNIHIYIIKYIEKHKFTMWAPMCDPQPVLLW